MAEFQRGGRIRPPRRVAIVGGGYSAASSAVQLVRASPTALAITIIEPRPEIGGGLAHSADDPDHRLNGTPDNHFIDPADPWQFRRWCVDQRLATRDPEAIAPDGRLFVRRKDFGAFVAETVRADSVQPTGSSIRHIQAIATDAVERAGTIEVRTANGCVQTSDLVIVATGNALPRLPREFDPALTANAAVIAAATDLDRVRAIPKAARVLVLGTGLTALDILSTLLRSGHAGKITAISRRGLRPHAQRPPSVGTDGALVNETLERLEGPIPPFVRAAGNPPTARGLLRALRQRVRQVESEGELWYAAFDELRDTLGQLWPTMLPREKIRALRRLRTWWDVHRFRAPPQNDALVREAEKAGRIVFRTARIRSATKGPDGSIRVVLRERGAPNETVEIFNAVINCTGIDSAGGARDNPFLASLLKRGLVTVDATCLGFAVDSECCAIGADRKTRQRLRIVGPPTTGTFGDPTGVPFIAVRIRKIVPGILSTLGIGNV